MVEIKEVKSSKEIRDFINFPIKLYKNCEYYVPMLAIGERDIFKPTHPYNKVCDTFSLMLIAMEKLLGESRG